MDIATWTKKRQTCVVMQGTTLPYASRTPETVMHLHDKGCCWSLRYLPDPNILIISYQLNCKNSSSICIQLKFFNCSGSDHSELYLYRANSVGFSSTPVHARAWLFKVCNLRTVISVFCRNFIGTFQKALFRMNPSILVYFLEFHQ